jgi:hypothetical protein
MRLPSEAPSQGVNDPARRDQGSTSACSIQLTDPRQLQYLAAFRTLIAAGGA